MPERRTEERPGAPDRRSIPRPPLWLNLLLIVLGAAGLLFAKSHRERVETRFSRVIAEEARTPDDVRQMKAQLAEADVTQKQLKGELQGRLQLMAGLKSENFYLSISTKEQKLRFYYGGTVLREADVQVGETKTISGNGRSWTFLPPKGAFPVQGKIVDFAWEVPEWMYAMNGQPAPDARPAITGGLGKYVIFLPNGYVIHSTPDPASPLKGPKPGSFMVSDEVLRAIWPRITPGQTQVYVY